MASDWLAAGCQPIRSHVRMFSSNSSSSNMGHPELTPVPSLFLPWLYCPARIILLLTNLLDSTTLVRIYDYQSRDDIAADAVFMHQWQDKGHVDWGMVARGYATKYKIVSIKLCDVIHLINIFLFSVVSYLCTLFADSSSYVIWILFVIHCVNLVKAKMVLH